MRFQTLVKKQNGVVLFIALIALLAMMMAAVALSSSVDTGAQVSTNRFLMQSSQNSTDVGFAAMKNTIMNKLGNSALRSKEVAEALQSQWSCYFPFAFMSNIYKSEPGTVLGTNLGMTPTRGVRRRINNMDAFVDRESLPMIITTKVPDSRVCKIENATLNETIYFMADLQCPNASSGKGFTEDCTYPNSLTAPVGTATTYATGVLTSADGQTFKVGTPNTNTRGFGYQGYGNSQIPSFAVPFIRVTVRVDGPRNTRTYRQQMISLFQNPAKP